MKLFRILMKYSDGTDDLQDEVFEDEDAAEEYAQYLVGCSRQGAEILELSNPGDYPMDDYEEPDYEIVDRLLFCLHEWVM